VIKLRVVVLHEDAGRRILRPGIAPFRLSVHSNQLAIAEVSLLDATVADAREQMQVLIGAATRAIDRALDAEAAA
jgi:hypothetical protein